MILCTGSIALDTTRTPFKTIERALGGSATFFSYGASFFDKSAAISVVGRDFPEEHWKIFEERGIDACGVQKTNGKTFFIDWSYDYDLYARKTNKIELNCLADFKPVVPEALRKSEYVYLGTLPPAQQLEVLGQMDSPKLSMMDTIELYVERDKATLTKAFKEVDVVLLNDVEARMYAKTPHLMKAAKHILDSGAETLLIKKGEHGCTLFHDGQTISLPAFPLEDVVDPTGAGDSFASGFMGHLARSRKTSVSAMKEAMAYGHVMGSFAVEGFGLEGLRKATPEKIEARYKAYKNMISF